MPIYRAQATVWLTDNVPANVGINTWHCNATDDAEAVAFMANVVAFYQTIDTHMAPFVRVTNGLTWKLFDLDDPEPRVPTDVGSATLNPGSGSALPTEVALCLSFQANPISGTPQGRRRNRVYLPFFNAAANDASGRPSTAVVNAINTAADTLWDASEAAADWSWVVYSPTDVAAYAIDNGWVDNEWDIQRRRGRLANSRAVFPI